MKHLIEIGLHDMQPLFKFCVCVSAMALCHEVFVLFVFAVGLNFKGCGVVFFFLYLP